MWVLIQYVVNRVLFILLIYHHPFFLSGRNRSDNIANNLTMAQEYNIAQQNVGTQNNYCQPELITRGGMREGSVVEDAVECNS